MYRYDWLILSAYFLLKNYYFYKYLRPFKSDSGNFALSISTIIVAIFFNYLNESTYTSYSEMMVVKGAIILPAFVAIYIAADFLSSIIILIYWKFALRFICERKASVFKPGSKRESVAFSPASKQQTTAFKPGLLILRKPIVGLVEFLRFFMLHAIFVVITETSWSSGYTDKFVNTNYICFISQLKYDIAVYTLNNHRYPYSIEDASTLSRNPYNNSKIIIVNDLTSGRFEVKDEFDNKLVDSFAFIGILNARDEKSKQAYLDLYKLPLNEVCDRRQDY